jgi:D-sedoheptulose 7-phosphate isomerase
MKPICRAEAAMNSTQQEIANRFEEHARVLQETACTKLSEIEKAADIIVRSLKNGGKLIVFGNGGSAADAQHIAAELVGKFKIERQALPAIALTTNTSILTALANDYGYDTVFRRQIEALTGPKDVVLGISTSGNSSSVIEAITAARRIGARTIGITGGNGGDLAVVAEFTIIVPSENTPRIQEAHITIGHIICEIVEKALAQE